MAPQLIAMKLLCLRNESSWIILLNISLPTPLSPWINTDKSVVATLIAVFSALSSNGDRPIIPNLCFTPCIFNLNYLYVDFMIYYLNISLTLIDNPGSTVDDTCSPDINGLLPVYFPFVKVYTKIYSSGSTI